MINILLNSDINVLFNIELSEDKLYALEEGIIGHDLYGSFFFDFTKYDQYQSAFTSGILLFKNSDIIKLLLALEVK